MPTNRRLDYFLLFLKDRKWKLLLFGREILVSVILKPFLFWVLRAAQQEAGSETREFRNVKARIALV